MRTKINFILGHDDGGELPFSVNLSIFSHPSLSLSKNSVSIRYLIKIKFT
jgi:hypothetical protein